MTKPNRFRNVSVGNYYNESGLRTTKTANGVTHSYTYLGSLLASDKTTADALYFHYDQNGDVVGFTYKAETSTGITDGVYTYVKNLQGDVIGILDSDGELVVSYAYDAWGNALPASSSNAALAARNPIRYRGYVYDTETKLYYLQSRYYDPAIGRFINADGYVSTGTGNVGYNMFVYCNNNPIMNADPSGHSIKAWIKSFVDEKLDATMGHFKEAWRTLVPGTQSIGASYTLVAAGGGGLSAGLSADCEGNICAFASVVGEAGTLNLGLSVFETRTNATNVEKLAGPAYQAGGTFGFLGYEISTFQDSENASKMYYGHTFSWSSTPAELHAGTSKTIVSSPINIFSIYDSFSYKVLQW